MSEANLDTPPTGSAQEAPGGRDGGPVRVREPEDDRTTSPATPPEGPAMPTQVGRYDVVGLIAQGGMGAVYKARDPDLGRSLALKVLLDCHKERPDLQRRFLEEAQIGGQLQHPGLAPVHELGRLPDGRPFFTMKLVKGDTLADLLRRRACPAEGLPRFLTISSEGEGMLTQAIVLLPLAFAAAVPTRFSSSAGYANHRACIPATSCGHSGSLRLLPSARSTA